MSGWYSDTPARETGLTIGGHCKPVTFAGYKALRAKHGKEVANALIELEEGALEIYAALVEKEKIDCDLNVTRAFDIFFDRDDARKGQEDFAARRKDFPQAFKKGDVRDMGSGKDVERLCGVKGAEWSASYPAGHLWPYLLATARKSGALAIKTELMSVIRICIQRHGLNIQTHTPATGLTKSGSTWTVKTPRGDIQTSLVIATTNAYTASILPDFKSKIIPVRGTASSITPAESHTFAGIRGPLRYTYGFRHGPGDTDYMIPRQGRSTPGKGDRSIILGGAKSTFLKEHELWYDNINDDELMPGARKYFEDFMPKTFAGWSGGKENVDTVWSGVLGYSADFKPFVGAHPDKEGVFVCAGFTGHGELWRCVPLGVKGGNGADVKECPRSQLAAPPSLRSRLRSCRTMHESPRQRSAPSIKRCHRRTASQGRDTIRTSTSSRRPWDKAQLRRALSGQRTRR